MNRFNDRIEAHEEKGRLIYRLEAWFDASPDDIWNRISNVEEIRSWDTMILEMEGEIREGGKVSLRSAISPNQKFKLRISGFKPTFEMTWSSGMAPFFKGRRHYKLNKEGRQTKLEMEEVFQGWLLPLMKSRLPDCQVLFGTYARDLRRALV